MLFDVTCEIRVPGMETSVFTRSVEATEAKGAISRAEIDLVQIIVIAVTPNTTGIPVDSPFTLKKAK